MARQTIPVTISQDLFNRVAEKAGQNSLNATIVDLIEKALREGAAVPMTKSSGQTTASGRAAAERGKRRAEAIANVLGGKRLSETSNLFEIDGQRTLVKSSSQSNARFGVYEKQLSEIDEILCASQTSQGTFELHAITPKDWDENAFDVSPNVRTYKLQRQMSGSQVRKLGTPRGELVIDETVGV